MKQALDLVNLQTPGYQAGLPYCFVTTKGAQLFHRIGVPLHHQNQGGSLSIRFRVKIRTPII